MLAFVLVALATAGLVAVFIRLSSADRLNRLIVDQQRHSVAQSLAEYYVANRSWEGLPDEWRVALYSAPDRSGEQRTRPPWRSEPPPPLGLADANGEVVIPLDPEFPVGRAVPQDVLRDGQPVMVDGERVGTVLSVSWAPGLSQAEALFLARTTQALLLAVVLAVLVALLMGWALARAIVRPLTALTGATQDIADGHLDRRVPVESADEIGRLAVAFNRMSEEVARVNRLRRQMTADIAHDLRTPLTVIAGYVESMQEGILEATPERLEIIYAEIERLQRLVGDLRMLAQADSGELSMNPQSLAPDALLSRAAAVFADRARQAEVELVVEAEPDLPEIWVDEERLMQVLGNLVSNSLRYTPSGGRIVLGAARAGDHLQLTVADSGSGIAAEDLPLVFERFQRADRSRHTESGASGLGLAIVKALVEAHGGTVAAESAVGQGTTVRLRLPVAP